MLVGWDDEVRGRQSACRRACSLSSPIRRLPGRLEIVRGPLSPRMAAASVRRIGRLLRLHVSQDLGQSFVLDDGAGFDRADLVENCERQGNAVVLYGEPAIRVVHHLHELPGQGAVRGVGSRISIMRS